MRAYRLASLSSQRKLIIESGRARRTEIYRRVQTAMARTMASTFTRREDGMLKGRRSTELQILLEIAFFKDVGSGSGLQKGLYVKVSLMEIYGMTRHGRALIESKAKQSQAKDSEARQMSVCNTSLTIRLQ